LERDQSDLVKFSSIIIAMRIELTLYEGGEIPVSVRRLLDAIAAWTLDQN
jgi:hypothetical protein